MSNRLDEIAARLYTIDLDATANWIESLEDRVRELEATAGEFFSWYNKTYQFPSNHPDHPWCRLGAVLEGNHD